MAPAATCSTLGGDWLDDALADGLGATNDDLLHDLLGDGLALADDALGGHTRYGALYCEHGTSDKVLCGGSGRLYCVARRVARDGWRDDCGGGEVGHFGHLGTTNERAYSVNGVGVGRLVIGGTVVPCDIAIWRLSCLYGNTLAIKCATTAHLVGTHDDAHHSVVVVKY